MIRFGDCGSAVGRVQDWLLAANFLSASAAVLEIQAQSFGPLTAAAVRTYQGSVGLAPLGVVDGPTWKALAAFPPAPEPELGEPDWRAMGRLEQQILRQADADYRQGVQELPPGSGNGPRIGDYQRWPPGTDHRAQWTALGGGARGGPYAARAIGLWAQEASDYLNEPTPLREDLPSAVALLEGARQADRLHREPRVGAVGLVGIDGCVVHSVLVARITPLGIETREAQSPHRVTARRRSISSFVGFVDLSPIRRTRAETLCLLCGHPPSACLRPECPIKTRRRSP